MPCTGTNSKKRVQRGSKNAHTSRKPEKVQLPAGMALNHFSWFLARWSGASWGCYARFGQIAWMCQFPNDDAIDASAPASRAIGGLSGSSEAMRLTGLSVSGEKGLDPDGREDFSPGLGPQLQIVDPGNAWFGQTPERGAENNKDATIPQQQQNPVRSPTLFVFLRSRLSFHLCVSSSMFNSNLSGTGQVGARFRGSVCAVGTRVMHSGANPRWGNPPRAWRSP